MNNIEEVYKSIENSLLNHDKPSEHINYLANKDIFKEKPFSWLVELKNVDQSPKYHPEGNVWNHVMLVVDEAAKLRKKSKEPRVFMWSALLHDIGKPPTTRIRKGRITSYDHDRVGEKISFDFLSYFSDDEDFKLKVSKLVRYHMHILYVLNSLPFSDIKGMKEFVDLNELSLLGLSDKLGRLGRNETLERENLKRFDKIVRSI